VTSRLAGITFQLRHPRTTVRWRLTLLYGGLFLVCGTALLAVTYGLVAHATRVSRPGPAFIRGIASGASLPLKAVTIGGTLQWRVPAGPRTSVRPSQVRSVLHSGAGQVVVRVVGRKQRVSDLHQLELKSAIALAAMTVLSAALGWLVAGRVLRPVRAMTEATQAISESNLHRRLAVAGPPDELRTLGDTINGLLRRLEGAFDAQRLFVANASHELRTPLTASRALLEMVLSDPTATVAEFRTATREALEESDRQEQLIDALLALAQGQRGLDRREPVRLDEIAEDVLADASAEAAASGVDCHRMLAPATVCGDARLIERLVSNLVLNAIHHNVRGGELELTVTDRDGAPRLSISNSGPIVPVGELERLLTPFQRLTPDRVGDGQGFGLGLSIVSAIADAHTASLELTACAEGGLVVEVRFPRAAPSSGSAPGVVALAPPPAA
jgi:signal transduction histidine kinase